MAFIQFSRISVAFGDRDILKDVSVNLGAGSKAALTGANGAGKSTLIKVMAGLCEPDSGERIAQKDARIAYLPQSGLVHSGCSLRDEADKAFAWGYRIQEQADALGDQMSRDPDGATAARLAAEQAELLSHLEESGWYHRASAAEHVLLGLGFSRSDLDKQTECFSGGWQMRIALAKCLMASPDILLLDEPTNYLDLEARNWLEGFLSDFKGGFLLVSHDRYFLDHTIHEVYELFGGALRRYPGNYTHYEQVRQAEVQTLVAEYEKQQAEIQKLEDFITRFGYKATKAAQAQERQKMLDKLLAHKIEIPENLKKIRFSFPPAPHAGHLVLTLRGITKSYDGSHNVLGGLDLVLENGDRLVVAGKNGAGKSTLLRIIAGLDTHFGGTSTLGSGVRIGYFSQDSAETITGSETVLERLERECPLSLVPKVRDMLGAFLFRGDDVHKPVSVLSGGEKSRIALLELLLTPVNLLVLDEPTNHLDMYSKDVLLDALKDFGGTVIFVSHDRGFIEELSTRVLELSCDGEHDGTWRVFPGDYRYYTQRLQDEADGTVGAYGTASTAHAEPQAAKKTAHAEPAQEHKSDTKRSWEEQKKRDSERRKQEREVERLEQEIARLEKEQSALEAQLADPAVYSDGQKAKAVQQQLDTTRAAIDQLTAQWEAAASEVV